MSHKATVLAACLLLGACASRPPEPIGTQPPPEVVDTLQRLLENTPAARPYAESAYGYAVFPKVTRAAFSFGGASGQGLLLEQGIVVGRVTVGQFLHGISFGFESHAEVLFFEDREALESFKGGHLEFRGRAGASAGTVGAANDPAFAAGVAIFSMTRGGLMLDLSVAGAQYRFIPAADGKPGEARPDR